jgi:ribose transport system permease protein
MSSSTTARTSAAPTVKRRLLARLLTGNQGPLVGLVLLGIVFSVTSDVFLSPRNFLNIIDQITVLGILALGMTGVIIIGGIDLSVGSILAVSCMVFGWLPQDYGIPYPLAAVIALLAGGACGLVNGLLITRAKLPPFIATLTVMSVGRGLANLTTGGEQVVGFPDWFTQLATIRHLGFLSATVAMFVLLALAGWVFLRYRATGRSLYAIGGNGEVARLAGIKVRPLTVWVYVASGVLAGLAGLVLSARLDSSQPSAGLGYELDAIAAVVIGGASLSGGIGGIGGTVVGVLIIGVLHNGLNLVGVSPFIQQVIIGCVIAAAVTIDKFRRQET